jgi:hypothetical protein
MRIGEIFRYAADRAPSSEVVDGYPNFFFHTATPNSRRVMLERGINPIANVIGADGTRTPAIVLSSSPHRIGNEQTPWQDFFNSDEGYVRYFGDAKIAGVDPAKAPGNSAMLAAKLQHDIMDRSLRKLAPPILLFRRVRVRDKIKGYPAFQGFGVIERAELIAQYDARNNCSFPNYAYDIAIFDMSAENEEFDWRWISDRRDPDRSINQTERFAPRAWKDWVSGGTAALGRVKRRVTKLLTTPIVHQRTIAGSREASALQTIYDFYPSPKKHRFELLAARIAGRILQSEGGHFRMGWVTPPSSDGGADFVGRLDIGSDFSKVKQIVFGQAKCEAPSSTTSGQDIARTVARLRRGWIGVYVTLGAFSEAVQREVIDDEYPILLIHGGRVAREVIALAAEFGHGGLKEYIASVDAEYDRSVSNRRPEEILRE